jgi:hypothetical protein
LAKLIRPDCKNNHTFDYFCQTPTLIIIIMIIFSIITHTKSKCWSDLIIRKIIKVKAQNPTILPHLRAVLISLLLFLHIPTSSTLPIFELFVMDQSDDLDLLNLLPLVVLGVVQEAQSQKQLRNTSIKGGVYLDDLLNSTPRRIYDVLRMRKETFLRLCLWLRTNTELRASRYISVQEQVAMFLWTINYSASNAQVEERF